MKISNLYREFNDQLLSVYEKREATNISDCVFEHVTGLKKWQRQILKEEDEKNFVSENQFLETRNILENLLKHKPLQYVLQEAWFYKLKFYVDENVLIPRPETEELASWIIEDIKTSRAPLPFHMLDVGTGSGCIAIALKKNLPETLVTAVDVSRNALAVAEKNASSNDCNIHFQQLDFLNTNNWPQLGKYHVIVSNPPYIPIGEKDSMDKNVVQYEPWQALFVENENPYIFYERIASFAKMHLKEDGKVYFEVHENYAREVAKLLVHHGFNPQIREDMYGKERMISASFLR